MEWLRRLFGPRRGDVYEVKQCIPDQLFNVIVATSGDRFLLLTPGTVLLVTETDGRRVTAHIAGHGEVTVSRNRLKSTCRLLRRANR